MTTYASGTFEVKLVPQDDKSEDALEAYYPTPLFSLRSTPEECRPRPTTREPYPAPTPVRR